MNDEIRAALRQTKDLLDERFLDDRHRVGSCLADLLNNQYPGERRLLLLLMEAGIPGMIQQGQVNEGNIADKARYLAQTYYADEAMLIRGIRVWQAVIQGAELPEKAVPPPKPPRSEKKPKPSTSEAATKNLPPSPRPAPPQPQPKPPQPQNPPTPPQNGGMGWIWALSIGLVSVFFIVVLNDGKKPSPKTINNQRPPTTDSYNTQQVVTRNDNNTTYKPTSVTYIDGEINYKKALKTIYGNLTYRNGNYDQPAIWQNVSFPGKGEWYSYNNGLVFVAFEGKFRERGKEKYILLTQTLRNLNDTCHSCIPIIGGAVFVKSGNAWIIESENKYIDVIGSWGYMVPPEEVFTRNNPVKLVKVGPDKHGLLFKYSTTYQGDDTFYINLIIPYQHTVINSLSEFAGGVTERSTGCENNRLAETEQDIQLSYKTNTSSDYYDMFITKYENEGNCFDGTVRPVKRSKTFKFANGYYR